MSANFLKAAVVGCGRIGAFTNPALKDTLPAGYLPLSHAKAIQSVKGIELVAMCDSDSKNLENARAKYGDLKYFSDYSNLMSEIQPDILSVATRTPGRCKIIEAAVQARVKALHVEKPISNNLSECRKALLALSQAGTFITYGATRRFMDIYRQAKSILDSGEIGDLVQIIFQSGRTLLLWDHPHSVDLMIFFSGTNKVESVQGNCLITDSKDPDSLLVDEDPIVESGLVKFANGVTGLLTAGAGNNITLCGTRGNIRIVADGAWIEIEKPSRAQPAYFTEVFKPQVSVLMSGTQRAFFELHRAITTGELTGVTVKDIEQGQKVLLSLAWSSLMRGVRVNPEDLDDQFTVTGKFNGRFA